MDPGVFTVFVTFEQSRNDFTAKCSEALSGSFA